MEKPEFRNNLQMSLYEVVDKAIFHKIKNVSHMTLHI